jgi:hypothetical protein
LAWKKKRPRGQILDLVRKAGKATMADIDEGLDELMREDPEALQFLPGCDLYEMVEELVQEGRLKKEVPKWGPTVYEVSE